MPCLLQHRLDNAPPTGRRASTKPTGAIMPSTRCANPATLPEDTVWPAILNDFLTSGKYRVALGAGRRFADASRTSRSGGFLLTLDADDLRQIVFQIALRMWRG